MLSTIQYSAITRPGIPSLKFVNICQLVRELSTQDAVMAHALCKYCAGIDPDAIWKPRKNKNKNSWKYLRCEDYDLRRSSSMRLWAQNGCTGCLFFLDFLRQKSQESGIKDATAVEDALQRDERIWIKGGLIEGFSLLTIDVGHDTRKAYPLDFCFAQGTVSLSQSGQISWIWS